MNGNPKAAAPTHADALVIGAGVIGASVALELARSGRRVIVVDQGPTAGSGSTSASASIIRFSYSTLAGVLTAWESAARWLDWAGHLGAVDPAGMARFVRTGSLLIRTPSDATTGTDHTMGTGATARTEALWRELGIEFEVLDTAALQRRFPDLDVGAHYPPKRIDDDHFADDPVGTITAVYEPWSGFIDDPMLAAHNLAFAAQQHGAEFRFRSEVTAITRADGRVAGVVLADGSHLTAPVVVNVGGPHSDRLNVMAGVAGTMHLRPRPLRQEAFTVPVPASLGIDGGFPVVFDLDLGQFLRPQLGGTLMVGGTEPECDPLEWVDDPDAFDPLPTIDRWETTMLRFARRAPQVGVPHRMVGLAAMYDVTDDWVPIYDTSDLPGFYMACGTSGNQFKNAPLAGMFLRAIIDAEAAGHDHDADPVQFVGPRTGRTIDLGAFSRRRRRTLTAGNVLG